MSVLGQPGALDHTFSNNGLVRTALGTSCNANDVKVQADGRIVAAGSYTTSSNKTNLLVVRYKTDGTLDNTFAGGDGEQGISLEQYAAATSLALQPDGKIVASGIAAGNLYQPEATVVRLNADGSGDNTFGTGGKLIITGVLAGQTNSVAVQADGKIVIAGSTSQYQNGAFRVFRLNTNGSFDNSFGSNGIFTINPEPNDITYSVHLAIQPDGKVTVCGTMVKVTLGTGVSYNPKAVLFRLNNNGTLDTDFGTNGIVFQTAGTADYTTVSSIALQADNKIVVGGGYKTGTSPKTHFLVMRFNTNGAPDNTFAGNGRTGIAFTNAANLNAIAIQADGSIVACGYVDSNTDDDFCLARLLPDGTPDTHFGTAGTGRITTGFGYIDYANGVALQPDGKIVAAGKSGSDMALSRYLVASPPSVRLLPYATDTNSIPEHQRKLMLYPNPASTTLMLDGLDLQSINELSITDATGKTLQKTQVPFSTQTRIATSSLVPGIYFLQVTTNGKTTTLQFVKK